MEVEVWKLNMKLGFPFSISILFWYIVGILRAIVEEKYGKKMRISRQRLRKMLNKVAVCIPAHNEEVVIARTITSLKRLVRTNQIYVVSDGSEDRTAQIARKLMVKVLEIHPGQGKARALAALLEKFRLLSRYDFILFVDADTLIQKDYLRYAIQLFSSDEKVAAIAGYVESSFRKHKGLKRSKFFEAYRVRLNTLMQRFFVYGQTWKLLDVAPVIPGSCSMYKTQVLKKLKLATPGIIIEDFSLAFQIHKKRLGRIAHHPKIFSIDQDPDNLRDYWNQVKRWNVGFYQTVRKQGVWPSLFWLSLGYFSLEVMTFSVFIVLLPIMVFLLTTQYYAPIINPEIVSVAKLVSSGYITLWQIFLLILALDYALTLLVAVNTKKYKLAVYGLGFFFFSYVNSLILLRSIPQGLLVKSKGRWIPPRRR